MEIDQLHELLEHADGASPPPVVAGGLTARILQRARRRAIRRAAIMALIAVTACGVAASMILRKPVVPLVSKEMSPAQIAAIRAEVVSLDADAVRHQQAAEDFRHHPARPSQFVDVAQFAPNADVLQRVNEQRERTALTLLRWADRTAADTTDAGQATEIYFRIASLFPETPAGRIAAGRLNSVPKPA